METKPKEVANCQNKFFISKVETLVKDSPPQLAHLIPSLNAWISGKTGHMALSCVHPDKVIKIIGNLSHSAAFGLDEIDTSTLKLIKEEID